MSYFQANVMMLGEMLCMLVFLVYIYCIRNELETDAVEDQPKPNPFLFLPPALCDVTATSMMYVGLTLTSASQFQMLRGSIMVFVGILSRIFLKKRLEWFRLVGMAVIIVGIVMVGAADFFNSDGEGETMSKAIIGDIIVICAQVWSYGMEETIKLISLVSGYCCLPVCLRGEVYRQVQRPPTEGRWQRGDLWLHHPRHCPAHHVLHGRRWLPVWLQSQWST